MRKLIRPFPLPLQKLSLLMMPWMAIVLASLPPVQAAPVNLEYGREHLYQQYTQGHLSFDQMLQQARKLDAQQREVTLVKLHVKDAGYQRKAGEADIPVRTGSTPGSPEGRGIYSDEDIQCETWACINRFRQEAKALHFTIRDTRFHMDILDLDAKIWKPNDHPPQFTELEAYHDYARQISQDPEYALGSRYGVVNTRTPLESVLENITKGQDGLAKPPQSWGQGYQPYETLIQLAKNTVRSLDATGLCTTKADTCAALNDLRKMRKSPEALGLFKHNASRADVLAALAGQQIRMKLLMHVSLLQAEDQMSTEVQKLNNKLAAGTTPESRQATIVEAQALREALYRIAVRYDVLANQYPHLMWQITGGESPFSFIATQMGHLDTLQMQINHVKPADAIEQSGL